MKKVFKFLLILFLFAVTLSWAQTLNPGVDRWLIKTTLLQHPEHKTVSLFTLLHLSDPITRKSKEIEEARIDQPVENKLKEGDLVTTTGWLQLVALESDSKKHRDGDYHIQLRTEKEWGDSCFIVEIPYPEFINDPALKDSCTKARQFIKDQLLHGKEPSTRCTRLIHPVFVQVTGQLFFDAAHLKGTLRGKTPKGSTPMHSYTSWELHPVVSIRFAEIPK